MEKGVAAGVRDNADANDPRACMPAHLLSMMHRSMFQHPVFGICQKWWWVLKKVSVNEIAVRGQLEGRTILEALHCSGMLKEGQRSMYTWKASGSRLVTLFKVNERSTFVFDHKTESCYQASEEASFGHNCPVGTAVLAQVVLDRVPVEGGQPRSYANKVAGCKERALLYPNSPPPYKAEEKEFEEQPYIPPNPKYDLPKPNQVKVLDEWQSAAEAAEENDPEHEYRICILLFDMLAYGEDLDFLKRPSSCARERYLQLREFDDKAKGLITSPCMKVQWAGDLDALLKFVREKRDTLSHAIDCVVQMDERNPLDIRLIVTSNEDDV